MATDLTSSDFEIDFDVQRVGLSFTSQPSAAEKAAEVAAWRERIRLQRAAHRESERLNLEEQQKRIISLQVSEMDKIENDFRNLKNHMEESGFRG